MEWIEGVVRREAERLLGDSVRARAAGRGFAAAMACDDLDAVTGVLWPRALRRHSTRVEGGEQLPRNGPVIPVSFHFSGGFRIFDVLAARGLQTTFLMAEGRGNARRYVRVIEGLRRVYLRRWLQPPYVATGAGARERLRAHLAAGGAVVALLDVAPDELGLRDHVVTELFGRPLRLPIGLMRLAASDRIPVIPFAGRIEDGRRVIQFYPALVLDDPVRLLEAVLRTFEGVLRDQPETWQGWLDLDRLFKPGASAQEAR
jgi:lauroyl/myristoyl acyltransferase